MLPLNEKYNKMFRETEQLQMTYYSKVIIVLISVVVKLLLDLIYKLNFPTVCMYGGIASTYRVQYYPQFQKSIGCL